jgi:hypothetical protein
MMRSAQHPQIAVGVGIGLPRADVVYVIFVERDGWAEQTAELRESLGYDTAPPLERMLIEYACVC